MARLLISRSGFEPTRRIATKELDVDASMTVMLRHNDEDEDESDYTKLETDPDEVEDFILLLHYKLG